MRHCNSQDGKGLLHEMERYCSEHPRSPAAVQRAQVSVRGRTYIALLGRSVTDGIVGFGATVGAALRAFDMQYMRDLRPPQG